MIYLETGLQSADKTAVLDCAGAWSYGELARHAAQVSAHLRQRERLSSGERVGLFLQRRKESVALLLGVFGAGGLAVPFSVRATARELAHQIVDADISRIIFEASSRKVLEDALALAQAKGTSAVIIESRALLEGSATTADLTPDPDAPALILYTSGTTGWPKGVVHTHASLAAQVETLHRAWEWSGEDELLHVLPLHHIHGLVNGVLGALRAAAKLRFLDAFSARVVWDEFAAEHATVFYAVPTIYHQLVECLEQEDTATRQRWARAAGQLRLAVSGSAALPARLWTRWQEITGQALLERYGMTEIGMAISNPYRGERRPGTVGQALPGMCVRIIAETGSEAGNGTPGEIHVRGPSLFKEYWGQPEATEKSFRDGYFLTGDIADVRDGYVRILGRASVDILKSGGYKISALEIEEVLREHPAVREVAVVGVPDAEWGEIVTACVIAKSAETLTLEQLRDWCRDKLAPYKLPRRLELAQDLPRNAMGKVTKTELIRQLTQARHNDK
ncbi:MAG: AMP-binding protein [Verrucomicrobia bacterium]|nr:AMP-binding protein [Verrucomicrobiota bacterium]